MSPYRPQELLIDTLAGMLAGLRHVAVGAASPIPGAAALLARARDPGMRLSILGSERHNPFTDGGRELFDCAAQGRIDAFFLGGGQIDGGANINLVGVGGYPHSRVRWPGSFGSAYLYFLVPRVILFREEHTARVLVPKVEFVSAPGTSAAEIDRPGGPYALVTGRCVFRFDKAQRRFRLASVHPGHTAGEVARAHRLRLRRAGRGATDAGAERRDHRPDPRPDRCRDRRDLSGVRGARAGCGLGPGMLG